MSKPRVFISSTYYDLKHIRSSLETFVERLGYEAILSEKGDIAYSPDTPLDESCYREARNADIFVLIVGGRYGSERSSGNKQAPKDFYTRYDSITNQEYRTAVEKDIPTYILIEKSVYADYETYLRNKRNETIAYVHVDSVNIFRLIEAIIAQPRNNPIHYFDKYTDIELWLRDQWAGLFRELLNRITNQQQLTSLNAQVGGLREINKTLKTYLEQVVAKVAPLESTKLIKSEATRLDRALQIQVLRRNSLIKHLMGRGFSVDLLLNSASCSNNVQEFFNQLKSKGSDGHRLNELLLRKADEVARDFVTLKARLSKEEALSDGDEPAHRIGS